MRFTTKDSGNRTTFDSGMVRDVTDGKTDYLLVRDGPMLRRWAELLTRGAQKYAPRNWMRAQGEAELDRFKSSAARHFEQWLNGEGDEDHAAAVIFNINGAEYVEDRLDDEQWFADMESYEDWQYEEGCQCKLCLGPDPFAPWDQEPTEEELRVLEAISAAEQDDYMSFEYQKFGYQKPGAATEAEDVLTGGCDCDECVCA